ncbi:MAG: cytoplasmic protein [Deltaproteobacteria bacterium RIFOXYA12_FULL_61_11]|nr:MAG: cytoplasmic protein [Deltaproteobacteria bacterium RIFOXYA12_FULL_61_11]
MNPERPEWNFEKLVGTIRQAHIELAAQAGRAVNISLTMRNWLIGAYIAEFELRGSDRASYGDRLLSELSKELRRHKVSNTGRRQLYNYLAFYRAYPQIVLTVPAQSRHLLPETLVSPKVRTVSALLPIAPEKLLANLAYSHFELIVAVDDELKRTFYEIECIRGNWSVRELKRQIASLYYERSGLSKDKKKLAELAQKGAEAADPKLAIRDPYVFEFLGLKPSEVMSESHLEDQLLDKIQDFLLELGHGFCFEARQKRILIGDTHNFVDLVFYHRVLNCHVLVELKLEHFSHENIGQLNTYVSWYKKNMMAEGDNPPIGILLCTQRDSTLVEYALAGMDNGLFVSKYQLELPKKEEMQRFIEEQVREAES